ncbi:unnamed protein product [Moneuplotes crassus]|uniref:DNA polymerase delta subunit 4 n=1 Tax=Euplotes crassus TaxID=5936 RepID=A0AAD2D6Q0_EUPCR|nr:unnamed protein product [Moneuplotes crassus]
MPKINNFFKNKKKGTTPKKTKASASKATKQMTLTGSSSKTKRAPKKLFGEDSAQALIQFDGNQKYGPAVGIPRIVRWERAKNFNLSPPIDIFNILKDSSEDLQFSVFDV